MSDKQQESKSGRLEDSGDVNRGVVSDTETQSATTCKVERVEEQEPPQKQDDDSNNNNNNDQDDGGDGDIQYPPQTPFHFPYPQHPYPQQPPPPQQWNSMNNPMAQPSLLQFYEAQMRDHAAAYASAAAGAAWVSAQIAADMASASTTTNAPPVPSTLPIPMAPPPPYMTQPQSPPMFYDPPPEIPYYHPPNKSFHDINIDADSASYGHRRKRQQRMAPSSENKQQQEQEQQSKAEQAQFKAEKRGTRRRRRLRNNESDERQQQQQQQFSNNRRRNRKMALASSSSDGGYSKKKQRQPSDESLLGKTGISALYEYCDKRRMKPTFTANGDEGKQDFEYIVSVDGLEIGRGRAKSKNSAKQEASRRALQVLVPGVVFDDATGILKKLPQSSTTTSSNNREMEDLAPNLAKRLAIGHTEDDKLDNDASGNDTRSEMKTKRHRFAQVYPGTSTTASDEDNDNFYASRGASVCSSLLHVMVQIDERIPEAPTYTYQVDPIPTSNTQFKRKAGGPFSFGTPVVIHRGSFTCTATLRLQIKPVEPNSPSFEILQTNGVGGTKREAKHTASAKLLAKLFPECEGMAAVKQAAEAAREKYAAGRALKQQSKRARVFTDARSRTTRHDKAQPDLSFALGSSSCPVLPLQIEEHILSILGAVTKNKEQQKPSTETDGKETNLARQYSRQQQLDDRITSALQKLNEHDEDGRCLPDELTVDDVGRTVLRRATQEDWHWITKLLGTNEATIFPVSILGHAKESIQDMSGNDSSSLAVRLWSSSTIVLLLCRAIAPYEDPPLGCAVLTLGFSLEKGRTLRIAQIASKSHLPLERFTEVLQSFANNMMYSLEASSLIPPSYTKMERDDIAVILKSHLSSIPPDFLSGKDSCSLEYSEPLMAVQEETEHDDSDSSPESVKKASDKRSKRSRVQ